MDIDRIHIISIYIGQHMHVMPTPPVKLQFSTLASPKNDTANPIEIRKDTWLFFWSISGVNFLGLDTVEN